MIEQVLQQLAALRPESNRQLSEPVIIGMTRSFTQARYQLYRSTGNPNGPGFVNAPTQGGATILQNVSARRRLLTIPAGREMGFTEMLNTALLGGESYPLLTALLSTVVPGGAGVSLLFSAATLAIDMSRSAQRILARPGDELWQVEEIGKAQSGGAMAVVHVGSYFLFDPYRGAAAQGKGWLMHEERHELSL